MGVTITDEKQHTLAGPVEVHGVGLFTGAAVTATIRPADADTGIVFKRIDLPGRPATPAHIDHVVNRPRRTALRVGEDTIETIEHCLAALAGMAIDNAVVELNGPELPAGDGSAMPFVEPIRRVGHRELAAPRRPLVISESVTVRDGDSTVAALPTEASGLELLYVLDYGERTTVRPQLHSFTLDRARVPLFERDIAPARTFSTQVEAEQAQKMGMFSHLTPKDMLVIGTEGPIDNTYRFEDEPARHKLLDLLGDLALVGRPVQGRVVAVRSGHSLNHSLARELVEWSRSRDLAKSSPPALDIRAILKLLPHRFPMVMVDRVLELEENGKRAVGVKNVTINEPFFQGHYPAAPIMPGVLIIEAMSQLAGLMLHRTLDHQGKVAVLLSIDGVKLRRPVTPGDQLVLEAETVKATNRMAEAECRAFVGGELAAEARVKFMMLTPEQAGTLE